MTNNRCHRECTLQGVRKCIPQDAFTGNAHFSVHLCRRKSALPVGTDLRVCPSRRDAASLHPYIAPAPVGATGRSPLHIRNVAGESRRSQWGALGVGTFRSGEHTLSRAHSSLLHRLRGESKVPFSLCHCRWLNAEGWQPQNLLQGHWL